LSEHVSKKFKSVKEADNVSNISHVSVLSSTAARPAAAAIRSSKVSRRIPNSDFMAVTGFDGQRVYVTMKTESFVKRQVVVCIELCSFCFSYISADLSYHFVALLANILL